MMVSDARSVASACFQHEDGCPYRYGKHPFSLGPSKLVPKCVYCYSLQLSFENSEFVTLTYYLMAEPRLRPKGRHCITRYRVARILEYPYISWLVVVPPTEGGGTAVTVRDVRIIDQGVVICHAHVRLFGRVST